MLNKLIVVGLCALAAAHAAWAQEKPDLAALESSLVYQAGKIELADGAVTLDLPPRYRFLGKEDAQRVIAQVWQNQADKHLLGMVTVAGARATHPDSWGIAITEDKHGHVHDSDAAAVQADTLIAEMKTVIAEQNGRRKRLGGSAAELLGWSAPPHYDTKAHALSWATQFVFEDGPDRFISHHLYLLGRENVVSLHALGSLAQKDQIGKAMRDAAVFTTFNTGARYADYNHLFDDNATYDLADIVRGETIYIGKVGRLWADLKHFNLLTLLGVIAAFVFLVWHIHAMVAKMARDAAARQDPAP